MSFKIDKDIGKIGEYYPIDFANSEPIYEHIDKELKDGLYIFEDGDMFMMKGMNIIRFKLEENK